MTERGCKQQVWDNGDTLSCGQPSVGDHGYCEEHRAFVEKRLRSHIAELDDELAFNKAELARVKKDVLPIPDTAGMKKWTYFLSSYSFSSDAQKCAVTNAWDMIKDDLSFCPALPWVVDREDDAVALAWATDRLTLELEVTKEGKYSWFFRDRQTNEVLGTEFDPENGLHAQVSQLLPRLMGL